jgi:hypothetical protein
MSLTRTLLRPLARIAARKPLAQSRRFLLALDRAATIQETLREQLVEAHAETQFGRDHDLAKVETYDDFRRAVPICDYEYYRPYMDRLLAGQCDALMPGGSRPLMFSMTSGSTGRPKYIPVTRRFLADIRRGWNIFGVNVLSDHPAAWLRPILQISSSADEQRSPTGLPCGAISGLLAQTQKRIVRRMYVAEPIARHFKDPAARYYTLLRCSMEHDVAFVTTANPSSTLKLVETGQAHAERLVADVRDGTCRPPGGQDISGQLKRRLKPNRALAGKLESGIERDGELLGSHFWDLAFLTNWTGGTLGLYLPRLRRVFPGVPIRDIGLLASEGRFSIPLADETPAGPADITSAFLEFIPAQQRLAREPETLRAHELEVGSEYFLVFSNWTSLLRYNLDDRVRVVDMRGQCPVIEFLCRGLHTSSITGEKLTEGQVVAAMKRCSGQMQGALELFTLQGCFADQPYYRLSIEAESSQADETARRFDACLREINIEYDSKRSSGRLGPVRPCCLEPGTFSQAEAEAIDARRGRAEQYKHQYLLTEILGQEG